jgi:hypothetical protein
MKKLVLLMVVLVFVSAANADKDDVYWNGTGLWMDWPSSTWTENTTDGGAWAIPGWVSSGNPYYVSGWGSTSNKGRAVIQSGTAQITSGSHPDGRVERLYVEGSSDAALAISTDVSIYRYYVGNASGTTGAVTQTNGDVAANYLSLGTSGSGSYAISGGSLSVANNAITVANSASSSFAINQSGTSSLTIAGEFAAAGAAGSSCTFNQTGGTATFSNTGNFQLGSNGAATYTISSGTFTENGKAYLGNNNGSSCTFNMSGDSIVNLLGSDTYCSNNAGSVFRFNQSGGDFTSNRLKLGMNDGSDAEFKISGGTFTLNYYMSVYYDATFKVSGSGATSIRMPQLGMSRAAGNGHTLAVELDAGGSTLIEVYGLSTDSYYGAMLDNATLTVNTLMGFDGIAGDVYDILHSATTITTAGLVFNNLSGTQFSWAVIDDAIRGGQTLQLTVLPEPMTIALMSIGGLLFIRRR